MKLTIDFETRSRVDLKTVGTYAYAEHPSTEIICMAAACEGEEPRVWMPEALAAKLPPGHSLPLCSVQDILSAPDITEIEAHNAIFEYAIWTRCAQAKYGFPALNPDSVSCSMALACTYALPASLDGAGAALGLPIQKDKDGHRLMLKMCKPNPRTWGWHENPHDLERLARYCMQDVRAEQALSKALGGELLPKERRLWQLTLKMNDRGVMLDVPLVHAANKIVGDHTARLLARTAELTSGVVASPKQVAALGNWVNLRCGKPVLKSADKAAIAEALARTDLPADVREVLEIRQSLGKSSTAKYQAMLDMACSDGRLRDSMVFHKASTGRYAGKGVQLQNFPRPPKGFDPAWALTLLGTGSATFITEMGEDPMWLASGALRSMIVPGPGNDLIVADYASVEARNVLWAAGEKEAVEMFVRGDDIYCAMAGTIYGRSVTKKDKLERQLGKTCVAEGSPVLTDHGVKPIEKVSLGDRVWDGVEWVRHDGVVYQGEKHVITYQGLTATPDHGVFTDFGPIPFGVLASKLQAPTRTGDGGSAVRLGDDCIFRNLSAEVAHICSSSMLWMLYGKVGASGELEDREEPGLPAVLPTSRSAGRGVGAQVRRNPGAVHQSDEPGVAALWRSGNPVFVPYAPGVRPVGPRESTAQVVSGSGDRPGGQRGSLCARESSSCIPPGADAEYPRECLDDVARGAYSRDEFTPGIQLEQDAQVRATGVDWRADRGAGMAERSGEKKELAGHPRKVRVYDILNCGPRGRFTVSGILVLNCILGCGYGMGAPKFLKTCLAQGLEIDTAMAQRAVDAYRAKYPGVPKFWWAQELAFKQAIKKPGHWFPAKIAHWMFRNRFLRCKLPSGRCLWYLDPVVANVDGRDQLTYMGVNSYTRKWERQTTFGGKLTENIISAISRDIMAEALPVLEEAGYPVVLTVHDEIIAEVPQGHGSLEEFLEIMTAVPEWAPGCPVGAEGWRNTRYGKG